MLIDAFNKTLDVWLEELRHYSDGTLLIKPDSSSWSVGQLYRHLIEETTWYFGQIELCLDTTENAAKEMTESAKAMFQNNSFPDIIIKGDPFISDNVKQPIDRQTLQDEFLSLKEAANTIWGKIESSGIHGKSQHPGIQFLNPQEWLQYAEMHMRHHLKQKSRIDTFLEALQ